MIITSPGVVALLLVPISAAAWAVRPAQAAASRPNACTMASSTVAAAGESDTPRWATKYWTQATAQQFYEEEFGLPQLPLPPDQLPIVYHDGYNIGEALYTHPTTVHCAAVIDSRTPACVQHPSDSCREQSQPCTPSLALVNNLTSFGIGNVASQLSGLWGLERLHPFDSHKFQRIRNELVVAGVLASRAAAIAPKPAARRHLELVHTTEVSAFTMMCHCMT
jgi:hypothetical protein